MVPDIICPHHLFRMVRGPAEQGFCFLEALSEKVILYRLLAEAFPPGGWECQLLAIT